VINELDVQIIRPLTSLRFYAAFSVFLSHLSYFKNFSDTKDIYENIFFEGFIGVTFFFILSGFILTLNYSNKLRLLERGQVLNFFVARVARIYPVHLLTFCVSIPLLWYEIPNHSTAYLYSGIANILLIQSFVPDVTIYFSYNMPSWSLSDEMFFYTLLPFSLYIMTKLKMRDNAIVLLGMGILLWLVMIGVAYNVSDQTFEFKRWLLYIFPLSRFMDFSIGVILGLLFCNTVHHIRGQCRGWFTLLEITSLFSFCGAVYFSSLVDLSYRGSVFYMPFFAFIIYVFALQGGVISKILSGKLSVLLGEISFSFYMIHQLILRSMEIFSWYKLYPVWAAVGCLFVTLGLSVLVYYYFELTMQRIIRRKWIF